ncbi:MAG: hypothetical protein L3K15_09300 [Thermoplasmata archaeon]|nr:hypothetical protein [Thermoplasmata archaeon]
MDRRQLWILSVLGLAVLSTSLGWFDYAAFSALFHPSTDAVGHTQFLVPGYSNTVYPFTYFGAAVAVAGVAGFIYTRERPPLGRLRAGLLGLVVGNLAAIGMIDCYEQVYLGLGYLTPTGRSISAAWFAFEWGTAGGLTATLAGLLVVLAILPWSRRQNWPTVMLCLGGYATAMGIWFLHGYAGPSSGDPLDYGMNALSRIASMLALVAAVSSKDAVAVMYHAIRGRIGGGVRVPAAEPPRGPASASNK